MDYVTKWVETKATQKSNAHTILKFLYEYFFTRYGFSLEIVSERGSYFLNETTRYLLEKFMIVHKSSTPYHPQDNGQGESTNNILGIILTKIVTLIRDFIGC